MSKRSAHFKKQFHATMRTIIFLLPVFLLLLHVCVHAQTSCDMIYFNGTVHTLDHNNSLVSAFAVSKGRIVAIGSDEQINASFRGRRRQDLKRQHVFPGFIDAHAHLYGIGERQFILQLAETTSKKNVLDIVANAVSTTPRGTWIRGRGWDQNRWEEKVFPDKQELDGVSSAHPIFLSRVDGHAAWVNSKALELGRITAATPDPPGGKILRDAQGEPTGVLLDDAVDLVKTRIPPPTNEQMQNVYTAAIAACARVGITGLHDMGMNSRQIRAIRDLIDKNRFPFRLTGYIEGRGDDWEDLLKTGRQIFGKDQLTLNGVKLYADGALGSRGALLLEDYSDDPGNRGIAILAQDSIRYESVRAMEHNLQICVHAIGDAANRLVLNAYESAMKSVHTTHLPPRIEHAQVLSRDDIPRFPALGVIPSMQPTHCTSDMYWAEARLGSDRVLGAYAWNSFISLGSHIPGGSDAPVEQANPIWGMYAACTRKDQAGRPITQSDILQFFQLGEHAKPNVDRYVNGWYGSEAVGRLDALKMFTRWAAEASGQDALFGSLETGRYADFVILSEDVTQVPIRRLCETSVLATYVGGTRVYSQSK